MERDFKAGLFFSFLVHLFILVIPVLTLSRPLEIKEITLWEEDLEGVTNLTTDVEETVEKILEQKLKGVLDFQESRVVSSRSPRDIWTPNDGEPLFKPAPQRRVSPQVKLSREIPQPGISGPDTFSQKGEELARVGSGAGGEKISPQFSKLTELNFSSKINLGEVDGPLAKRQILRQVLPEYPPESQENGRSGKVGLKFWVEPGGLVSKVEIVETSGDTLLDQASLEALKKWRFAPLDKNEPPQEQWGLVKMGFYFQGKE